jgi:hypothetical protein
MSLAGVTPLVHKIWVREFFSLFYIIITQKTYLHQKLDTNSCFAKLRAISNLFSFFLYTLYVPRSKRTPFVKKLEQRGTGKITCVLILTRIKGITWVKINQSGRFIQIQCEQKLCVTLQHHIKLNYKMRLFRMFLILTVFLRIILFQDIV